VEQIEWEQVVLVRASRELEEVFEGKTKGEGEGGFGGAKVWEKNVFIMTLYAIRNDY